MFERRLRELGHDDLAAWTDRSPHLLEAQHVRAYAYVAEQLGARMYIQHATPETFSEIREARRRGVSCTPRPGRPGSASPRSTAGASTCPCATATPRRPEQGLARGDVDVVGSDHVVAWPRPTARPCTARASGTAAPAWVETFLPVMLTHGVHEGRITLERLVQVCCENPARIYGLFPRKGTVAVGSDADLVVVDLSREVTVPRAPEHPGRLVDHGGQDLPWLAGADPAGRPGDCRMGRRRPRAAPGGRARAAVTPPRPSGPTSPRNPRTGWSAPGPTPPWPASARI